MFLTSTANLIYVLDQLIVHLFDMFYTKWVFYKVSQKTPKPLKSTIVGIWMS